MAHDTNPGGDPASQDLEKQTSPTRAAAADHDGEQAASASDTSSTHHDKQPNEKFSHHSADEDDDDDDDDESSHHHDPEPEGPEGLNTGPQPISRVSSRAASTSTRSRAARPLVVVPRGQRRGLFAVLTLVPEVERPYDYSRKTKWVITTVVALAAAGGPLGSNIMYRKCGSCLFLVGVGRLTLVGEK